MYSKGRKVRNRITTRIGEVLESYGHGVYRIRYPVYGDEDRDFDINIEMYTDIEPIGLIQCDKPAYGGYFCVPS